MGGLVAFELQQWIDEYKLTNFLETGVGAEGNGIAYAQKYPFERIISVNIDKVYYERAVNKFKDDKRVEIYYNNSKDFLNEFLPIQGNTLFWLDAHFPETHIEGHIEFSGFSNANQIKQTPEYLKKVPEKIRMPLEDELRIITQKQDISSSVILIDDYRCYEPYTGNFELGIDIWKDVTGSSDNNEFMFELLSPTHDIKIDRRHSGYLVATPKK